MNSFDDHYVLKSNAELLFIINNSNEYLSEAINAAKRELISRNLSAEEKEEANAEFLKIKQNNISKAKQSGILNRQWIENAGWRYWLCLGFFAYYLLTSFLNSFDFYKNVFNELKLEGIDITFIFFFLLKLIEIIGIILFWRKNPWGWLIFLFTLYFSFFNKFWMLIIPEFDISFLGIWILLELIIIFTMLGKSLRNIFNINRRVFIFSLIIGGLLCIYTFYNRSFYVSKSEIFEIYLKDRTPNK